MRLELFFRDFGDGHVSRDCLRDGWTRVVISRGSKTNTTDAPSASLSLCPRGLREKRRGADPLSLISDCWCHFYFWSFAEKRSREAQGPTLEGPAEVLKERGLQGKLHSDSSLT